MTNQSRRVLLLGAAVVTAVILAVVITFNRTEVVDADALLKEARQFSAKSDHESAGKCLDRILSAYPNHSAALLERAKLWMLVHEPKSALADLSKVEETREAFGSTKIAAEANLLAGRLSLEVHRASDAERFLSKAWKLQPRVAEPLELLLRVYILQMRRTETLKTLERLSSMRALSIEELVLTVDAGEPIIEVSQAVEQLKAFIAADPSDKESLSAICRYYLAAENPAEALKLLSDSSQTVAGDSALVGLEALCILKTDGNATRAATRLKSITIDDKTDTWWWQAAGTAAEQERRFDDAAACFRRAVALRPYSGFLRYRLGQVLEASGRREEAEGNLATAAAIDRLHLVVSVIPRMANMHPQERLNVMLEATAILRTLNDTATAATWEQFTAQLIGRPITETDLPQVNKREAIATAMRTKVENGPLETVTRMLESLSGSNRVSSSTTGASTASSSGTDSVGKSPIRFAEVQEPAGLNFSYFNGESGLKHLIEAMGGGIGVIDFDLDGRPDCYFPQGSRIPNDPNQTEHLDQLFRNIDGLGYINVRAGARVFENGYSLGVAVGDVNNDGFGDLYVANFGQDTLLINQGDGTFLDQTAAAHIQESAMSTSVSMADLDHDGNLDIYVDNYVDGLRTCRDTRGAISTCNPQNFSGVQDMLWHNQGDGSFQDGVERFGLAAPDGKGLGVVVTDLNNDGWEDIYVANDTTPNFLFRNKAGAKFEEIGLSAGVALSPDGQAQAGMGIGAADYNNDGWIDICVTNFYDEPNNLYINHRDDFFTDEAARGHLLHPSKPMLGFGVIAEDFDADGDPDLIVANGHIDDYRWRGEPWKMPTQVFRNLGDAVFEECSQSCGDYFSVPTLGRGAAVLDWNNDGKLDVLIVHQDRPAVLLENRTPGAECIAVRPIALAGNRSAVGARLVENGNTERVVSEIRSGNGYISSSQQAWWIPKAAAESGHFFMVFPGSKPQSLPSSARSGEIFFQTND